LECSVKTGNRALYTGVLRVRESKCGDKEHKGNVVEPNLAGEQINLVHLGSKSFLGKKG
jgi:hypothetical protein